MRLLLAVIFAFVLLQVEAKQRSIFLYSKTLHTYNEPDFTSHEQQKYIRALPTEQAKWLIHLEGPITPQMKKSVEKYLEVELGQYYPHNTYMISGSLKLAEKAKTAPYVLWVGAFLPQYKTSGVFEKPLPEGFEKDSCHVHIYPGHSDQIESLVSSWRKMLTAQNIKVEIQRAGNVLLYVKASNLLEAVKFFAEQHEITWMEPVPVLVASNQYAVKITAGDRAGQPLFNYYNLSGGTERIAILDTALNRGSCFFENATITQDCRALNDFVNPDCSAAVAHDHGTHIAGTVIGRTQNAENSKHSGYASKASLYHLALPHESVNSTLEGGVKLKSLQLKDLMNLFSQAQSVSPSVVLFPFAGPTSAYDTLARELDSQAITYPNTLLIIPAGNDGAKGAYGLGSPAVSKNGLTVGSCQNDLDGLKRMTNPPSSLNNATYAELFGRNWVSSFSSRGPTTDGRVKPDVVAPGEVIFSASKESCGVVGMSGTSMAAANAAGAAVLLRNYLVQGYYAEGKPAMFDLAPTAIQIKALLINSGADLLGSFKGNLGEFGGSLSFDGNTPNGVQGFGRINLPNIAYFSKDNSGAPFPFFLERNPAIAILPGQTIRYCFNAQPGARIKVTLVWNDPQATAGSPVALVNNLDLAVVHSFTGAEFRSNGAETFDDVNNVEQVEFVNPINANFSRFAVYVHGTAINSGDNQTFTVVISGASDPQPTQTSCDADNVRVCPNFCSGNGVCETNASLPTAGLCTCNKGFYGLDCSISFCPNNCGATTSEQDIVKRGSCDFETGKCICAVGWSGASCEINSPPNNVSLPGGVVTPREPVVVTTETGESASTIAAAIAIAVVVGLLLGIFLGWFIAVKALEAERKKRREQLLKQGGR